MISNHAIRLYLLVLCAALLSACASRGRTGAVATVQPLATESGLEALRRGGNAVDAAVAAAVMLGVVDQHNSGIGGGCFMLIRRVDGTFLAIDGREMAPAAAHRNMYVRDGQADPSLSTTGALAIGVPGSLAAYDYAVRAAGWLPLADPLERAADLAEAGFPIDANYAARLKSSRDKLARFDASRRILLDEQGNPFPPGHTLEQPDLAATYRAIADRGVAHYYGGPFAEAVENWMGEHSGIATAVDFANYSIKFREPVVTTYRGYTIVGFPPPSSGGVHVAQILNILETFDLRALNERDPALRYHVIAEAMKLAFADRAHWLGDPDFAEVPTGLIDKAYAKQLASRINLANAITVEGHGTPPRHDELLFDRPPPAPPRDERGLFDQPEEEDPAEDRRDTPPDGLNSDEAPGAMGKRVRELTRADVTRDRHHTRVFSIEPLAATRTPLPTYRGREGLGEGRGRGVIGESENTRTRTRNVTTDPLAHRTINERAAAAPSPNPSLRGRGIGEPADRKHDHLPSLARHTTHIAAADEEGNVVAITATNNTAFGSGVIIPGTGVVMNNQMDDFSIQPGVPNVYGLIGAEANSIQPGKRPLSSMSPTIVLKDGKPVFTLGAAGGPTIISQVVQAIVNHVDLGMPLPDAVAAARIHHQWRPNTLFVEADLPVEIRNRLTAMGHNVKTRDHMGITQAIGVSDEGFVTVVDPRLPE